MGRVGVGVEGVEIVEGEGFGGRGGFGGGGVAEVGGKEEETGGGGRGKEGFVNIAYIYVIFSFFLLKIYLFMKNGQQHGRGQSAFVHTIFI